MISKGSGSACFNVFLFVFFIFFSTVHFVFKTLHSLDKTSMHEALFSELKITLTPIVNLSPIQFPSAAPVSHPEINSTTHHRPLLTLQPASKGLQGAGGSMAGSRSVDGRSLKSGRHSGVNGVSPDTPAGAALS